MLRKIAEYVIKIFRMEPIPTTANTLREALQALEVARNHFENCDPEFVDAYADKMLAGRGGVGIYPPGLGRANGWVHVDVRKEKSRWRG